MSTSKRRPEGLTRWQHAITEAKREMRNKHPNLERAWGLLKRAHEAGQAEATYAIGTWYLHGRHVTRNGRRAIMMLRAAARANVPEALFDLAVCYERGVGVRQNPKLALEYYLGAALLGDKQALYEVGRCYYHGIGVERDRKVARIWLDRARALGIEVGQGTPKSRVRKRA